LLPVLDDGGRYVGTAVEMPVHLARASTPAAPDALDIRTRLDAGAEGLTLLGANLDTESARPGERLYVTLFWQAGTAPLPNADVLLTLGDATLYAGAPVHGTYPTTDWTPGEVVADRYDPRLSLDTPPGDYPLQVSLSDMAVELGTVTVQATDRVFDVPPISHPLRATLGEQVELMGYDLVTPVADGGSVAPGETITLTLYWRALAEMDESYTVFTHLLAPDGLMAGQRDNPPIGGTYPTNLWLAGEVIADVYEIPVRTDAAPGAHRLEVGMYVPETGTRLPVGGTSDDAILLQTIHVGDPTDDSPNEQ
jgi:hypothetical protein